MSVLLFYGLALVGAVLFAVGFAFIAWRMLCRIWDRVFQRWLGAWMLERYQGKKHAIERLWIGRIVRHPLTGTLGYCHTVGVTKPLQFFQMCLWPRWTLTLVTDASLAWDLQHGHGNRIWAGIQVAHMTIYPLRDLTLAPSGERAAFVQAMEEADHE